MNGQVPGRSDMKTTLLPRLLLCFSSLVLALAAVVHAAAFNRALAAVGKSNLAPFFGTCLESLWLADSTTCLLLSAIFGLIAARPSVATRSVVLLLALIPTATAILIYTFLGPFFAGHFLLLPAVAAFVAGLRLPGAPSPAHKLT
jgi:hypothetical protein